MWRLIEADVLDGLRQIEGDSVQCAVTSPPYWGCRDYKVDGQIGLEPTMEEHITRLVEVFREVRRVMRPDGTLWLNYGDSWSGGGRGGDTGKSTLGGGTQSIHSAIRMRPSRALPAKQLLGMPWRLALALQADGWWLRSEIIWHKPNGLPDSARDRPGSSHEHLLLLSPSARYYYDLGARRTRDVWTIATQPFPGAHFATFPEELARRCVLLGSRPGDTVLDPFAGSGTTLRVAERYGRDSIGIEISPEYCEIARRRIAQVDVYSDETDGRLRQPSLFSSPQPHDTTR